MNQQKIKDVSDIELTVFAVTDLFLCIMAAKYAKISVSAENT